MPICHVRRCIGIGPYPLSEVVLREPGAVFGSDARDVGIDKRLQKAVEFQAGAALVGERGEDSVARDSPVCILAAPSPGKLAETKRATEVQFDLIPQLWVVFVVELPPPSSRARQWRKAIR
jgi:hypothetical protein